MFKTILEIYNRTDNTWSRIENGNWKSEKELDKHIKKLKKQDDISFYFKCKKNETNIPEKYKITGWTEMKNKTTPFNGEIIVKDVIRSNFNPYHFCDSTNFTIKIEATYNFIEDKSFSGAGVFKGNLYFTLVLDKENNLHNELWDWMGDGYSNFQYQGIWISPTGEDYKCIFGAGRIENSGDLDVGDGSFVPNEKYYQYGWADFFKK